MKYLQTEQNYIHRCIMGASKTIPGFLVDSPLTTCLGPSPGKGAVGAEVDQRAPL